MFKVNKRIFTGIIILTFSTNIFAEIDRCQSGSQDQKDFVCGSCELKDVKYFMGDDMGLEGNDETNRDNFANGLFADLSNPDKKIKKEDGSVLKVGDLKSVEDFIDILPNKFKENVVFMSPSRSLQEGDRYLLKSPNSELVFSFNSHPKKDGDVTDLRGGNAVEAQVWNGEKAVWEYVEIDFSEGKPQVTRNPDKCLNCHGHGTNTRPNFDPYNFWSQSKPFMRDTLVKGTKEADEYLAFLEKIKKDTKEYKTSGKKTRYSILAPLLKNNNPDQIKQTMNNNGYARLSVTSGDGFNSNADGGSTVNLFDQMYLTNHCRIADLTTNPKHNPYAEKIKYALAAAVRGSCISSTDDLSKFIPEELIENSKKFFKAKRWGNGSFEDAKKEITGRQRDYYEDRIGRKLWNLESQELDRIKEEESWYKDGITNAASNESEIYKLEIRAEKKAYQYAKSQLKLINESNSFDLNGIRDKEESIDRVAPLVYLLEPLGIDTSMLSISVDPNSYTFGDFFFNVERFGAYKELRNESCSSLRDKSKAAFLDSDGKEMIKNVLDNNIYCSEELVRPESSITFKPLYDTVSVAAGIINQEERLEKHPDVAEILNTNCVTCHSNGINGAPPIPFDNMKKLDQMLSKQAGELGSFNERIKKRILRHGGNHGSMPFLGDRLEKDEQKKLIKYLEDFKRRDYVKKIDTGSGRRSIIDLNE